MKRRREDLAVYGGSPAFSEKLYVGRPNIGNRERFFGRMNQVFDSARLANHGPFVQELEQRIADLTGARHCIAVSNGTIGLELAIRALKLQGEVIVPSWTFVATVHALQWHGLTPIFCDIDPQTHNIDPNCAEKLINERTSALLGVHLWGKLCAPETLEALAQSYNIKLLFDAAHALGCAGPSRRVGNFGDAEVFSFHATKFINSFQGEFAGPELRHW